MGVAVTPDENGVVIAGTVVAVTDVASHNGHSLMEMKRRFESELGLSGTMIDVVDAACLQLGVSTSGLTVMQKAERAYDALDGTPSPAPIFAGVVKAQPIAEPIAAPIMGVIASSPAPTVETVTTALTTGLWNAGKPGGGGEGYSANPWRFTSDGTFITERDNYGGGWTVRLEGSGVVLRMDWRGRQTGNYAEFAMEPGGVLASPAFRARASSYGFMRSWALTQRHTIISKWLGAPANGWLGGYLCDCCAQPGGGNLCLAGFFCPFVVVGQLHARAVRPGSCMCVVAVLGPLHLLKHAFDVWMKIAYMADTGFGTSLLLAWVYMYYVAKIRRAIVARDQIQDEPTKFNPSNNPNDDRCSSIPCENYWCVLRRVRRATQTRPRRRCWCCVTLMMFRHDLMKRDNGREYSSLCSPTGLPGGRGAHVV